MVVFFVSRRERETLRGFFETWGPSFASQVRLVYYEALPNLEHLPGAASYIFTDLERLTEEGRQVAQVVAARLERSRPVPRLLNHPGRALGRYDLLRSLHRRRLLPYQVHRPISAPRDLRFPVFLRDERGHQVLTPLLHSWADLEHALIRVRLRGHNPGSIMLAEFEDTSDAEGVFRLYSGYVIGDALIPGILASDDRWEVKLGRVPARNEVLTEDRRAGSWDDREPTLRFVARIAGIEYGRFDYALSSGDVCLWELNTNPTLLFRKDRYPPSTRETRRPVADALLAAIARLDRAPEMQLPPVRIDVPRIRGRLVSRYSLRQRRPVRLALAPVETLLGRMIVQARRGRPLAS